MGWREFLSNPFGRASVPPKPAQPTPGLRRVGAGDGVPSQGAMLRRSAGAAERSTLPPAKKPGLFSSKPDKVDELEAEVSGLREEVAELQARAGISAATRKRDRALQAALSAMEAKLQHRANSSDVERKS